MERRSRERWLLVLEGEICLAMIYRTISIDRYMYSRCVSQPSSRGKTAFGSTGKQSPACCLARPGSRTMKSPQHSWIDPKTVRVKHTSSEALQPRQSKRRYNLVDQFSDHFSSSSPRYRHIPSYICLFLRDHGPLPPLPASPLLPLQAISKSSRYRRQDPSRKVYTAHQPS